MLRPPTDRCQRATGGDRFPDTYGGQVCWPRSSPTPLR